MASAHLIKPRVSKVDKLLETATSRTRANHETGYQGDAGEGLCDARAQMHWDEGSIQSVCIIRAAALLPTVQEITERMNIHVHNLFHVIKLNCS